MQVLTGKEEQRDICSIGLKTVVLEMPQVMAVTAVRQLAPKLVSGLLADVNTAPALVGRQRAISPPRFPPSPGRKLSHSVGTACLDRSLPVGSLRTETPASVQPSGVAKDTLEVKLESMDILNDLLKRFGGHLREEESDACLTALFKELGSARAAARKRAIACIASLSAALPDKLLGQVCSSALPSAVATALCRRHRPLPRHCLLPPP
jgi:hypothetical protein